MPAGKHLKNPIEDDKNKFIRSVEQKNRLTAGMQYLKHVHNDTYQ